MDTVANCDCATEGDEVGMELSQQDMDIISHPTVQALLSEEKGKRWALLTCLYEREANLEKQIEDLRRQLKEQTSLANHFKSVA